ncbi:hypothetical protein AVDCRST_MAG92-4647 [uncultured Coleofasciculus sp.]|uniref:Uncharacterized protein n=1 Tax=uncultured Coleofasciculus sp. TaxID=1267456 RepID=A0A6J4K5B9_9CYAN|nr:hypothetical protein AVDCRST_MAG92-4647 [uncultured Coleofasciculus sp.]
MTFIIRFTYLLLMLLPINLERRVSFLVRVDINTLQTDSSRPSYL